MFFRQHRNSTAAAKAVCATCGVITECLDAAMEEEGSGTSKSRYGVRGGLTGYERRVLAKTSRNLSISLDPDAQDDQAGGQQGDPVPLMGMLGDPPAPAYAQQGG